MSCLFLPLLFVLAVGLGRWPQGTTRLAWFIAAPTLALALMQGVGFIGLLVIPVLWLAYRWPVTTGISVAILLVSYGLIGTLVGPLCTLPLITYWVVRLYEEVR